MKKNTDSSAKAPIGRPFVKGQSGNPGGRKPIPQSIKDLARASAADAIQMAVELMNHADPNVRIKALNVILDRAYGKAPQPMTGEDGEGAVKIERIERVIIDPTN